MITITVLPIDPTIAYKQLNTNGAGSVVAHLAVVKPVVGDKKTLGIRFTPLEGLEDEVKKIEAALRKNWMLTDVLLYRRVGELHIGEGIMLAVIAAPNREDAFGACQEAVNRFKKLKCIQKQELFEKKQGEFPSP